MNILIVISTISFINLIDFCISDKHIYGNLREDFDYKLYETVLIDSNNTEPKSYDIIFKYLASYIKPVGYIEFDVNSPSNGTIEAIKVNDVHPFYHTELPITNFHAKIHINDTLNVKATLKIYKRGTYSFAPSFGNLEETKSLAIVYAKNASPTKKIFAQNSIGKRQMGDKLIHFQSRNITNASRFPSRSFEYAGDEYITYVGFSFNSPTAMVLVNTTFINEKEFNAVLYDMNTEHFVANISVYGIESTKRPDHFSGVAPFTWDADSKTLREKATHT